MEYIRKKDIIEKVRRMPRTINPDLVQYSLVKGIIAGMNPEDVAPVVRCRECKHYREFRTRKNKQIMRLCYRMGKHDMEYHVKPDDFCSYGERKQTETNN